MPPKKPEAEDEHDEDQQEEKKPVEQDKRYLKQMEETQDEAEISHTIDFGQLETLKQGARKDASSVAMIKREDVNFLASNLNLTREKAETLLIDLEGDLETALLYALEVSSIKPVPTPSPEEAVVLAAQNAYKTVKYH